MTLSFLGRVFLADRAIKEEGYFSDKYPEKYPDAKLLEVRCTTSGNETKAHIWTDFDVYQAIYSIDNDKRTLKINSDNGGLSWGKPIMDIFLDGSREMDFPDNKLIELQDAIQAIRNHKIVDDFINVGLLWPIPAIAKRVYTFFVRNPKYNYILVDAYTKEISFR